MSFFDRLANAWNIFKTSVSFIGRDKSLLAVPLILIGSAIVLFILFVIAYLAKEVGLISIVSLIIFLFLVYVWTTFWASAQSWMVYEVAQGKDATLGSGVSRALKNLGDIFLFALTTLIIRSIAASLRRRGGIAGRVTGGFIDLITGIAGKLVIPAMIVTNRNFFDSVKQLGEAIKTIPEIATYEIGIRPLKSLTFIFLILVTLAFGLSFGFIVGIGVFLILLLAFIVLSILVDQIYYTLLYLTLIEKKHIKGLQIKKPSSYLS